jgi:hypothetical protein
MNQCGTASAYYIPAQCSAAQENTVYYGEIACNPTGGDTCGDGICNAWENSTSCLVDCPVTGGGGGGGDNTGSIDISINPYTRSIYNGQTTTYILEIRPVSANNLSVNLNLTNCPAGATCSISGATSFLANGDNVTNGTVYYRTVNVTANSVTASSIPYIFYANAVYGGYGTKQASANLIVSAPISLYPSVYMDNPINGQVVANILYVWGVALDNDVTSETAISSRRIYLDNTLIGNPTPYNRSDICAVWVGRPGCPNVGYEFNFNTTNFSNGPHSLRVEVTDSDTVPK